MIKRTQILLLVIGAAAVAGGAYRGELTDIFRKATLLCLECIGIG